jgi:nucleoid DNA-binding protein
MKFDYLIEDCVAVHGGEKVTKKKAEEIIRDVFENIKLAMAQGEGISIRGFGSFKPVEKKGRVYIEPRNQKPIKKGPSIYPKFTPSGKLKAKLNGKDA